MTSFADSSALVKLYVEEPGSSAVDELGSMVVSQLARVEVPAALWRLRRTGELRASATRTAVDAFVSDYSGGRDSRPRFTVVSLSDAVLGDAAALTGVRGLRAYDAVQLASARAAAAMDDRVRVFAAFDRQLRAAAAEEGFVLMPS